MIGEILKENLANIQLLHERQQQYADEEHALTTAEAEQLFTAQQVDAERTVLRRTIPRDPTGDSHVFVPDPDAVEHPTTGLFEEEEHKNPDDASEETRRQYPPTCPAFPPTKTATEYKNCGTRIKLLR